MMRFNRRDVIGLVVLCSLVMTLAFAWYRVTQPFVTIAPPPVSASALPNASSAGLERHVRKLALDFPNRSSDNPTQLHRAADYIEGELAQLGFKVVRQEFVARGQAYRNLLVSMGPETTDVLVIGAHYDVAGKQPGADDNASGVAGLLELARLLKSVDLKQKVELVAYTLEEPPYFGSQFMGSAIHAKAMKRSGKRASLMLSLECIGYFSDVPGSQDYPVRLLSWIYPTVGNFIALVGYYEDGKTARRVKAAMQSANSLPVRSINAPGFVVGVDFSDHRNYWSEGFVGMMVTDTAFYRNMAYHTPDDTPQRLDYRRMAQVVDGVRAVVLAEAGAAR